MSPDKPKMHINQKAVKRDLAKEIRPEHANYTFRFEKDLFERFRNKAEKEKHSATRVLEALMRSYLGR